MKKNFFADIKTSNKLTGLIVIIVIACIGTALVVASRAASNTSYASVTADSGSVTNGAATQICSGASDGSCVVFGGLPCSGGCSVVNNTIENASSQPVIIHGIVRTTLEDTCIGTTVNHISTGIPASDFATMHNNWNANGVRLTLNQDFWLSGAAKYCSTYQATVQTAVKNAEANNMIVILDLHWSDAGNLANTNENQQCMPDQNSVTFWQQVAEQYKNDPNVWFELYNEPYPPGATTAAQWSIWQNGGSVTCKATYSGAPETTFNGVGMQQLVNTVRATGANNIVLAGALTANPKTSLNGVPFLTGGNVGYTVHPYDTGQSAADQEALWDTEFGNVSSQVPVVATEFGDLDCGDPTYENALLSYFKNA